ACQTFSDARAQLEAGGSPYAAWAAQQVVTTCLLSTNEKAAVAELNRLETMVQSRGYLRLLGRVHWMQGLVRTYRGELTQAVERYSPARENFQGNLGAEDEAPDPCRVAERNVT